jgi:F-type H+-transporting ATPase subunit epsilon
MAETFTIEIATPERLLWRDQAQEAQIPALDGYIGVLPDHAALLSSLGAGVLTYLDAGGTKHVSAIKGGFLEINDNVVRVLTDAAEKATEVDSTAAQKELERAQAAMVNPAAGIDIASALIEVQHAQARLDAAKENAG